MAAAPPKFDDIPSFDDMPHDGPAPEGELATAGREAAHAVVPGAAGLAGMGYGAAVGSGVGPVGTFVGGLAGLIIGSYAGNKVQDAALNAAGFDDSEQVAANAAANPKSAVAGGIAGSMVAMNPAAAGVKLGERVVGAGGMAAFDAGQQLYQKGTIDPSEVAMSGAAGFVAPRLNRAGEAIAGAGARLAGKVPGRPSEHPNPAAAPAQDEAASSQQATATGDTSLEQQAPAEDGSTTGNPQSASTRSARAYPKEPTTGAPSPDMLTEGNFSPDIADALQSSLDSSATIDRTPAPPIPDATNGVNPDMTYKGEQLPIKTGLEDVPQTKSAQPEQPAEQPAPAAAPAELAPDVPVDTGIVEAAKQPAAPAEEPAPVVGQFQTSKGSTYDLHPDNTTTRNKAARPDPGHEGDEGPKPRSAKTYFMDRDNINRLGFTQNGKPRIVDHGDGTLSMATFNEKEGKYGISPESRNVPIASMEPKEGLHPLEVWSHSKLNGLDSYGAMHPGNEITQLGQNGKKPVRPVVSDEALLDISRVQREAATKQRNVGQDQEPPPPTLNTDRPAAPQKFDDIPDHPLNKIVPEGSHAKLNDNPTGPQIDADNYGKGHSRLFGRDISIENKRGEMRRSKPGVEPKWEVEMPYDYGDIKGTKGADGDNIDIGVVGTGERHFVVDQRKPDGSFDEHKVMAYAKDASDAMDHYERGFSDGKGSERLGSIKEATADELKAWLGEPGAKKKPYDPNFKDKSTSTAGEKPLPKIVTAAVKKAQEMGRHDAAEALLKLDPSKRIAAASKIVNDTTTELKRPDRIRSEAPKVGDLGVTARSKADAARKSADVQTMNIEYEKLSHVGDEIPQTPEAKQKLARELKEFAEATKGVTYKPNVKTAPYLFARAVKKLMIAKNPTAKSWADFIATAKSLKEGGADEVRSMDRAEADIGRSKRSGDDAIANAENKAASTNDVEDQMIANIDAKKEAARKPFELDAEHTETETKTPVTKAADLEKFENKTNKLDLSKKADRARLSEESRQLTENLIKQADRKAAEKPSEEKPASAARKIDHGGIDHTALLASLEKATKKNSTDPNRVSLDEIGKHTSDFFTDNRGSVDFKKVRNDWNVHVAPRVRGLLHTLFGKRTGDVHITADALMRQAVTSREKLLSEVADKVDGHMKFYDTINDKQQIHVQESVENQKGSTFNKPQLIHDLQQGADGLTRDQAKLAADHYDVHKPLYDWLWAQDRLHGSEEGYVENYAPHIFEEDKVNGKTAAQWINAHNTRLGATWYQKNRLFDTIKAARAAGFKLKYTNPIDALNARMNASLTGHMMVDIARALQKSGLAERNVDASDFQKRFYTMKRTLPDNNNWLFHPDVETLWKNAVEDKGLQGMDNVAGGLYRGWMKWKRTAVPIQLSMSLFHEAHILSIAATNELSRAAINVAKGDSFKSAYGDAFKSMKQDLLDMPLGRFYRAAEHPGKTLQENWGKDSSQLSQNADIWNKLMTEGGMVPKQAAEDSIGAKRDFARAVRNFKMSDSKLLPGMKLALPALQRGVEKSTEWMFKHQIPQLKVAAFKRMAADELRHDPGLVSDDVRRKVVMQRVAKNVDDRFGEKFYKGWFINKGLKDSMLGTFVSTGWQAGQLRQAGGAAVDAANMAKRWVDGADHRSPLEKAAEDHFDKISFVGHYVGGTMLASAALSYALSGKIPSGIDYLYPRTGYDNDDGTPNRVSTPFNTREGLQLKAHIDAHNSVMGGIGEYIWNKTVLQPIADLMTNKNFRGEHMWDPDSNPVKQVLQAGDATLGTMFNPIAASGASKAYQTQGVRGAALSVAGFGPAPKYVEKNPLQRRIGQLYNEDVAASNKPYQYGPKTGLGHGGVQDIVRAVAGDKTEGEARTDGRQKLIKARKADDQQGVSDATQELIKQGHVAVSTVKSMMKGAEDTSEFARLPATDQIRLAAKMSTEDYDRYVRTNTSNGITKVARAVMAQQFEQRNLNR